MMQFHWMFERLLYRGLFVWVLAFMMTASVQAKSPAPLVHYNFDQIDGKIVSDQSGAGRDGTIVGEIKHYDELKGRRGVLRFDGEGNRINLPLDPALQAGGDLTLEMWVRRNKPGHKDGTVLGWGNNFSVLFGGQDLLAQWSNGIDAIRTELADQNIFSEDWAHVVVVVESPRIRLNRNGELIADAYMPFSGIEPGGGARVISDGCAIDLDEVRIFRRALTTAEIKAHARGEAINTPREDSLRVDTHWYEQTVTVRLSVKGAEASGHVAE